MKIKPLSLFFVFAFLFLLMVFFLIPKLDASKSLLEENILATLRDLSESKSERISDYLYEKKADVKFLSGLENVKKAFDKNVLDSLESGGENNKDSLLFLEDLEEMLINFKQIKGYKDIIFVDEAGDIFWKESGGNNIGYQQGFFGYQDTRIVNLYPKVKDDQDVSIYQSGFIESKGEVSLFATMPILEKNNQTEEFVFRGFIALHISSEEFNNLIESEVGLENIGEIYAVDREGYSVSSLKYKEELDKISLEEKGVISKKIETELKENCFKSLDNYYFVKQGKDLYPVEKFGEYENYVGEEVFGSYSYLLDSELCILAEANKKDFFKDRIGFLTDLQCFSLCTFLLISLSGLFLSFVFKFKFKILLKGGKQ